MKSQLKSNNFDSSIFFKRNMKINKNLPKAYGISILISLFIVLIG